MAWELVKDKYPKILKSKNQNHSISLQQVETLLFIEL